MSIVALIKNTAGRVRNVPDWIGGGFKGYARLGLGAAGAASGHYSMGHEYGSGVTMMYAAASMNPFTGIALGLAELGIFAGNSMYKYQSNKRSLSFVKNKIDDKFGTIKQSRQFSIQQLTRDKTAASRVLGNEARLMH